MILPFIIIEEKMTTLLSLKKDYIGMYQLTSSDFFPGRIS